MKVSHIKQPLEFAGDERWEVVHRILQSRHFVSCARLRDFLVHVTACALMGTPEEVNEQQIGIRVFQRRPGFNTSEDSIVRSHARLLRMKLAAYFASDGGSEAIRIEIPKGTYLPVFSQQMASQDGSFPNGDIQILNSDKGQNGILVLGPRLLTRCRSVNDAVEFSRAGADPSFGAKQANGPSPLDVFWGPMLNGPRPMVIYSNEPFVGSHEEGLRYATTSFENTPDGQVFDHLTGVGEVQSIFNITRLFERRGIDFTLKRGGMVPWDEARQTNLILIGSATENPALRVLPVTEHFHIAPGADAIVNHKPLPGESRTYCRSNHPITRDYAVISFGPGLMPSRSTLVFAGLTTLGTQAAVEFACSAETVTCLMREVVKNGVVRPFAAILEVNITGGVPLRTQIAALRVS